MGYFMPRQAAALPSEVASFFVGKTDVFKIEIGGDTGRFHAGPITISEPRLAVTSVRRSQVIDTAKNVKIDAVTPDEIGFILDFGHWHSDLKWVSTDRHLAVGKYGLPGISTSNEVGEFVTNRLLLGIENFIRLFTDWMKAKAGFDSCRWSVSCILQEKFYSHIRIGHWTKTQSNNLPTENLYPRALIGFHNIQLAAENPPTRASKYDGQKDERDRN